MTDIQHSTHDCTGNWRLRGTGRQRLICCETCTAEHAATPDNRLAAIDENYAGIFLRRLAHEGAVLRPRPHGAP